MGRGAFVNSEAVLEQAIKDFEAKGFGLIHQCIHHAFVSAQDVQILPGNLSATNAREVYLRRGNANERIR